MKRKVSFARRSPHARVVRAAGAPATADFVAIAGVTLALLAGGALAARFDRSAPGAGCETLDGYDVCVVDEARPAG